MLPVALTLLFDTLALWIFFLYVKNSKLKHTQNQTKHAKYFSVTLKFKLSWNFLPFPNRLSTDETRPFSLSSMSTFYMAFQISCIIKLTATNVTGKRPYKETDMHRLSVKPNKMHKLLTCGKKWSIYKMNKQKPLSNKW